MSVFFESAVTRLGHEATEMIEGGVLILFAEPVPEELADVSVLHMPTREPAHPMQPGDVFCIGDTRLAITAVGGQADENLRSLGHLVLYLNPAADAGLLPGAIHATGNLPVPAAGDRLELHRPTASQPTAGFASHSQSR